MKTKLLLCVTLIALVAGCAIAAAPFGYTVGTNAVPIFPKRGQTIGEAWATNVTYAAGHYVVNAKRQYMARVGGTSTNLVGAAGPTHTFGTATDASVTWLYVQGGTRRCAVMSNTGTNNITWAEGGKPTVGNSNRMEPNVKYIYESQGEIWAVCTAPDGTLSGQELENQ